MRKYGSGKVEQRSNQDGQQLNCLPARVRCAGCVRVLRNALWEPKGVFRCVRRTGEEWWAGGGEGRGWMSKLGSVDIVIYESITSLISFFSYNYPAAN